MARKVDDSGVDAPLGSTTAGGGGHNTGAIAGPVNDMEAGQKPAPPAGKTAADGQWYWDVSTSTWKWRDYGPGHNATPEPNPFGNEMMNVKPEYTPYGLQDSSRGGFGAFGGSPLSWASNNLVPSMEQIRMQRFSQFYGGPRRGAF